MSELRRFFPVSFVANDLVGLIKAILIYIIGGAICGAIIGLLGRIPLIGIVFDIIGSVVGIYSFAGLVIAVLFFLKLLK